MKWPGILTLCIFSFGLAGCADEKAVRLGPQNWGDLQVVVESRPTPVRAGMNEFIVIASREKVKPGVGLIVSMRVDEKVEWRQAIQDGYTGVYRRAIRVNDPQTDILAVHLRKAKNENGEEENEKTLYFPLSQNQE